MPVVVYENRWNEQLRRLFGARSSLSLTLLDDILPVAQLFDPSSPEMALPRGERAAEGQGTAGAVAGQNSFVSVENPTSLQAPGLVIIDAIYIAGTVAAETYNIGILTDPFFSTGATVGTKGPRDGRRAGLGSTSIFTVLRQGTNIGLPVSVKAVTSETTGKTLYLNDGWVLPPRWVLVVSRSTANAALGPVSFTWRERAIDPAEL
jgi:hypothetical protein